MHMTAKWARCIVCGTEFYAQFDQDDAHSRDEAEALLRRKIERCCK